MDLEPITLPGVDPKRPIMIAGPCSAESEEQVMQTARGLAAQGIKIFRAGIWKPRTKPGSFEGVGLAGLPWLKRVKAETGMYITTEVASRDQVGVALAAGVDMLWIGARTTVNPFAVQEIAGALRGINVPVLIKNPVNPELDLWVGAIERFHRAGLRRIGAIHRGFSSHEKKVFRNEPLWHLPIELRYEIPNLPVFCDPSHISGKREFVPLLSQQAMDLNFDGLMIETHHDPSSAMSDAKQQMTPDELEKLLKSLIVRDENRPGEKLSSLRNRIDHLDEQLLDLLAERMRISCEIGTYKKEHNMPVLQSTRYNEIVEERIRLGCTKALNSQFVREILLEIHEESVRQQMEVMTE
ncbi:MAG: bifunctional 3-deoxy-7-phosphoheptulonate synthase/chorismate mutase type II [Planctomycetaceae bacterium]|nr:bifunctional 3-deoxy-7-phosphoheptulonate synthase/chorismate mutase type II [Planctomycetaceae bacterium]